MVLFFEMKPPCFEVFLGYEFDLLFCISLLHSQYFKHTDCVCIYIVLCTDIHRTSETAFTAIRLDLDSSNKLLLESVGSKNVVTHLCLNCDGIKLSKWEVCWVIRASQLEVSKTFPYVQTTQLLPAVLWSVFTDSLTFLNASSILILKILLGQFSQLHTCQTIKPKQNQANCFYSGHLKCLQVSLPSLDCNASRSVV